MKIFAEIMVVEKDTKIRLTKELYKKTFMIYHKPLCLFALKLVEREEEAEDIVHNVFLSIWEKQFVFNDEIHLKAFLFRAVYNQAITYVNHINFVNHSLENGKVSEVDENNYLKKRIESEIFLEVMQALKQLPTQCGEVFKLSYIDGLKVSEVAERLRISENTVKTQRLKARKLLQEALKDVFPLWWLIFVLNIRL